MIELYPKDTPARKIGSKASSIVHYKFNTEHWIYRPESGLDYGRDCTLELIENETWRNHKLECQIKGTLQPKFILNEKFISQNLEFKTLMYAFGSNISFVLLVVDVNTEIIYYQCLQDYYQQHKEEIDNKLKKNGSINIRIPIENVTIENDIDLQNLAKKKWS